MGKGRNYQSSDVIYRPSDGEKFELPKNLLGSYSDPALWAYSTLPPGDYDDLVNIHIVKQGNLQGREAIRQRIWLHDILDDEGIPYQVVIKSYWVSRKKYAEDQFIYVEEKHSKKAKRLIKAFNNPENIVSEVSGTESSPENYVNGVLQIKCSSCGEEIDFDYHKCPLCKQNPKNA